MSIARKCDKCGKFHEFYTTSRSFNGVLTINTNKNGGYMEYEKYDLCKSCRDELKDWLEGKENK